MVDSKDRFLASVSHELRAPLTVVLGLAHGLKDRHDSLGPNETEALSSDLVAAASDIAHIVEDVLVATRGDLHDLVLEPQTVDARTIVAAVAEELGCLGGIGVGPPLWAITDELRLRQIVRTLISNAIRHGGNRVRVVAERVGTTIAIAVRDDGKPLLPTDRERIFDPYQRATKSPGMPGSVGLGLTVSRQLARLMDGDITYRHDGSEAVFELRIPAGTDPREAEHNAA